MAINYSPIDGFHGVYEGIVESVKDDSKQGKVKIKLPWYDDKTVFECRVRQLYAGDKFGAFFIPEPKTEVLVAFIQGDMRFPIILGGLYNGKDKPPTYRDDKKDEKMIRTKAGHRIIFDDTSGKEKIVIMEKDEKNSIVIDTSGDSITITAKSGKLTLTANEVEIKSKTTMKIEAGGEMTVKGSTINLN